MAFPKSGLIFSVFEDPVSSATGPTGLLPVTPGDEDPAALTTSLGLSLWWIGSLWVLIQVIRLALCLASVTA